MFKTLNRYKNLLKNHTFFFLKHIPLLAIACLLTSCGTMLENVWQNHSIAYNKPLRHILVFYADNNEGVRRNTEDKLVANLLEHHAQAQPMYQVGSEISYNEVLDGKLEVGQLQTLAKKTNADSVLIIYPAKKTKRTHTSFYYGDYYGVSNYYGTSNTNTYDLVTLGINLYSVPSAELLWSANCVLNASIRKFSQALVQHLIQDQWLLK